MNDDDRLGLGGNNPPEPTPIERAEQLIPACDGWTGKGALTSDAEADELSEFLVQLRKARAALIAERDAAKKPYEDALLVLDYTYKGPLQKLDLGIERIAGSKKTSGLLADWMQRKQEELKRQAEAKRLEAEQAQQDAEHAADRAAVTGTIDDAVAAEQAAIAARDADTDARHAPVRARVKGNLAPKAAALHPFWSAVIVDWPAARRHYRNHERVVKAYDETVQKVANDDARRLKDPAKAPPGVQFHKREQVQ